MLQKLPKTLANVKGGNTSENLLNETRQSTKNMHDNITNSINVEYKTDNEFLNSKNTEKSDPSRLLLNINWNCLLSTLNTVSNYSW